MLSLNMLRAFAAAVACLVCGLRPLSAQVSVATHGGVEWDAEDLAVYMAGAWLALGGGAVRPVVSGSAASLTYPTASVGTNTITVVSLDGGLAYVLGPGALTFTAGYAFTSEEQPAAFGVPAGGQDTPVFGVQYAHWGTGRINFAIGASYATRSEYFWSRARWASLLREWPNERAFRFGGEAVYQSGAVADYSSVQTGAVLDFQWNRNLRTAIIPGFKSDNRPDTGLFPYLKLEFLVLP